MGISRAPTHPAISLILGSILVQLTSLYPHQESELLKLTDSGGGVLSFY